MLRLILVLLWFAAAAPATQAGLSYYRTPVQERPFLSADDLFASSALVGHGYGVVGTLFILVGVVAYAIRKRALLLQGWGKLKHWLQVHIFLCTLGPYLILLHTTFRVGGIVAIAFWSMVLVVGSGVFGRYLYARIPKTLQGHFLSLEALEQRRVAALSSVGSRFGLDEAAVDRLLRETVPARTTGTGGALFLALRWDMGRRRAVGALRARLKEMGASPHARRELAALLLDEQRRELQIALLRPFQRLFRYWHVFHLPLAIVMFLTLGVHVIVVVLFGYVWIF